jgi:hypothetical protein
VLCEEIGHAMSQCEHKFEADPLDGQVKCALCSDLDDEMELVNIAEELAGEKDDFYATQESFE